MNVQKGGSQYVCANCELMTSNGNCKTFFTEQSTTKTLMTEQNHRDLQIHLKPAYNYAFGDSEWK